MAWLSWLSSASLIVSAGASVSAGSASVQASATGWPPTTGASPVAVMLTTAPAVLLVAAPAPSLFASVTWMLTVRFALVIVGSSELLLKLTLRSAVW